MSSVYNLLMGVTWRESFLDRTWGIGSSGELGGWGLGLVDHTPWRFWTRCPIMVALTEGKYLVTLARVIVGHDDSFSALMAFSHVDRTGYLSAAWRYLIKAATPGRS